MIPFENKEHIEVSDEKMQYVFDKLKTPYKYGPVLKFDNELCDSPTVYKYNGRWYMSFIKIDKNTKDSGYESHIAVSDDLVHFEYLFPTLKRNEGKWDSKQVAAYAAFVDTDFGGEYKLNKVNDKYYFAYLGGNLDGYETDPLHMGLSFTTDVLKPELYQRLKNPILSPSDEDVRDGEELTTYKSFIFIDENKTLGFPYVNFYNAKGKSHKESIFIAVSNDGENWTRYGDHPVIYDETIDGIEKINGDPQIIKLDDIYVAVFFNYSKGKTWNTFACSYDLIHWKKWTGEKLIKPEYEWENLYAHKSYIVVKDEIVYHYYCACNDKGERFIALATSKEIK